MAAVVPVDPRLSAIAVPLFPAWIMFELFRFRVPIFDYRVIYLFAHFFWLSTWNSSSLISQQSAFPLRTFESYPAYVTAVTVSCLLALIMPNVHFPKHLLRRMDDFRKPTLVVFLGLFGLSLVLSFANLVSTDFSLVLLLGPMVVASSMFILLVPANTPRHGIILAVVFSLALSGSLLLAVSRTAVLLPIWCCGMAFFLRNFYFQKVLSYWIILIALPVLVVVAIVADGIKVATQIGVGLIFSIFSSLNFFDVLQLGFTTHNYLQTNPFAALYYFSGLDNIGSFHGQYFGILFFQIVSIFFPRRLFPGKPDSDVIRIMYDRGEIELNAQYDPFFEKMADAGIPGVVFYSFLPMVIAAVLAKAALRSKYPGIQLLGIGVYTLNMGGIFLSTRGPYIVLAWTVLPCIFLAALLFIVHLRERREVGAPLS